MIFGGPKGPLIFFCGIKAANVFFIMIQIIISSGFPPKVINRAAMLDRNEMFFNKFSRYIIFLSALVENLQPKDYQLNTSWPFGVTKEILQPSNCIELLFG